MTRSEIKLATTLTLGDRIKFTVACREGLRTATRKVNGFYFGKPTVRFRGYGDFVVAWREIKAVNGASMEG